MLPFLPFLPFLRCRGCAQSKRKSTRFLFRPRRPLLPAARALPFFLSFLGERGTDNNVKETGWNPGGTRRVPRPGVEGKTSPGLLHQAQVPSQSPRLSQCGVTARRSSSTETTTVGPVQSPKEARVTGLEEVEGRHPFHVRVETETVLPD